jgi:hypothetical protein
MAQTLFADDSQIDERNMARFIFKAGDGRYWEFEANRGFCLLETVRYVAES